MSIHEALDHIWNDPIHWEPFLRDLRFVFGIATIFSVVVLYFLLWRKTK